MVAFFFCCRHDITTVDEISVLADGWTCFLQLFLHLDVLNETFRRKHYLKFFYGYAPWKWAERREGGGR